VRPQTADAPSVDASDVSYVLDAVNWSLGLSVTPGDLVSGWAGLRPLLAGEGGPDTPTADLSRKAHLSTSPAGLPVGLQIAAKPFDEETIYAAAHAFESATEWHRRRPPLAEVAPPV